MDQNSMFSVALNLSFLAIAMVLAWVAVSQFARRGPRQSPLVPPQVFTDVAKGVRTDAKRFDTIVIYVEASEDPVQVDELVRYQFTPHRLYVIELDPTSRLYQVPSRNLVSYIEVLGRTENDDYTIKGVGSEGLLPIDSIMEHANHNWPCLSKPLKPGQMLRVVAHTVDGKSAVWAFLFEGIVHV